MASDRSGKREIVEGEASAYRAIRDISHECESDTFFVLVIFISLDG